MATQTTYYNFNKPAGTDLVNPLTDTIPNWDLADAALHGLSVASIGTATEVVTLGVHALTRVNNPDAKFFQFIATGDYDADETFTVDGVEITAAAPDGSALATDCYVTGSVVLCSLNADDTLLTLYVPASASGGTASDSERLGGELPAYYASKSYADTIKDTADAASSAIAKKALVNVYYNPSTGKFYRVLSDGSQGGEITMARKLDLTNMVTLNPSAGSINYTTPKDGLLLAYCNSSSSTTGALTVAGKTVYRIAGSGAPTHNLILPDVPSGTVITSTTSVKALQPESFVHFIPYA